MLTLRRIIFYIFVLVYLVLCPLLILYSLGYVFSPLRFETVTRTGLIHISSQPQGAMIYLDKSRFTQKTPATISGLTPGKYHIRVRLNGYKSWQQPVEVEPGEAVSFHNVRLIPSVWISEQLYDNALSRLFPLEGADFIALINGSTLGNYLIYDVTQDELTPLLPKDSSYGQLPVVSLFTKIKSTSFIAYAGPLWDRRYIWFNLREKKKPIQEITKLFGGRPDYIDWDPQDPQSLFIVHNGEVRRLDVESSAFYPEYLKEVIGFGLYNKWVYYIDKQNRLYRISYDKYRKEALFDFSQFGYPLFDERSFYKITLLRNNIILFLSDKGEVIVNQPPYQLLERDAIGALYNEKQNLLLYWTRHAIGLSRLLEPSRQEQVLRYIPKTEFLYERGNNIEQCFWADDNHIIFKDANEVYVLELEPKGRHHIDYITKPSRNTEIYYSENTGSLYYLDEASQALSRIEIIKSEGIIPDGI